MSRRPRIFLANLPYHIIQRGNNKNPIFFADYDYLFFLKVLQEAKAKHPCLIYSYCLMGNHFHLLAEPKEKQNISLLMKLLGAKYVHYVNRSHNRTGTLWEGRFKCSLIEKEQYFLTCLHYIEMNPLRAGIVGFPELYRWSSYRFRAFGEKSSILDLDPWYNGLGRNPQERQVRYQQFFRNAISSSDLKLVREMTNKGGFLGSSSFKEQIEMKIDKEIIIRPPGRPKKREK
ncbi:transposase [Candidatus Omnitrophota bacterium]